MKRSQSGIIIGLRIIFAGFSLLVSELYEINVPWEPLIMIFFGRFRVGTLVSGAAPQAIEPLFFLSMLIVKKLVNHFSAQKGYIKYR